MTEGKTKAWFITRREQEGDKYFMNTITKYYNIIPEIKNRFSLEDAINFIRIDKLKLVGNKYIGICPLPSHQEKTPSWVAWRDRQRWKCYGCNEYGDQIDLVAKATNRSNNEAIKMLADHLEIRQDTSFDARTAARQAFKIRQRDKQREEFAVSIIQEEFIRLCGLEKAIYRILDTIKNESDLDRSEVVEALKSKDKISYWLDSWQDADDAGRLGIALMTRGTVL